MCDTKNKRKKDKYLKNNDSREPDEIYDIVLGYEGPRFVNLAASSFGVIFSLNLRMVKQTKCENIFAKRLKNDAVTKSIKYDISTWRTKNPD